MHGEENIYTREGVGRKRSEYFRSCTYDICEVECIMCLGTFELATVSEYLTRL